MWYPVAFGANFAVFRGGYYKKSRFCVVPAVMGVFSLCKAVDLKVLGSGRRESVVGAVAEGCVKGWRALRHVVGESAIWRAEGRKSRFPSWG